MGISIRCHVTPEVPGLDSRLTDGKNLSVAYLCSALGGLDIASLEDGKDATPQGRTPCVFDALIPFIDKSTMLGSGFQTLHAPKKGLAAIHATIASLRSSRGSQAVPDTELREATIADLEEYAKTLRTAEQHGASFTFYFEV